MIEPPSSFGTFAPKEFTNILVLFCLYHSLVFRKVFYPPYRVSLFKALVIAVQIVVFYIGVIIISEVDKYEYRGAIWYVFSGRTMLVGIFTVWMIVGMYWLKFMFLQLLQKTPAKKNSYKKLDEKDYQSNEDRSQGS